MGGAQKSQRGQVRSHPDVFRESLSAPIPQQHLTHLNYGSATPRGAPPGTLQMARSTSSGGDRTSRPARCAFTSPPALTLSGAPQGPPFFRLRPLAAKGRPQPARAACPGPGLPSCVGRGVRVNIGSRELVGVRRTLGLGGDAPRRPPRCAHEAAPPSSDSSVYLASLSSVCSEPCEPPNSSWRRNSIPGQKGARDRT